MLAEATHVRSGIVPAGTLHYHGCPECYEKAPCFESCTIEPDLSDERPTGAYGRCSDCATTADVLYGIDDPAEGLEVLHTRRRWPWSPGAADAPWWHCMAHDCVDGWSEYCHPVYGRMPCVACCATGHAEAPGDVGSLVACANLGERLVTAVALARTLAGDSSAVVILRVESAEWLEAHHEDASTKSWTLASTFSIEMRKETVLRWPERCPYWPAHRPTDAIARINDAWSALRALAATGVHLLAIERGTVTLGIADAAE